MYRIKDRNGKDLTEAEEIKKWWQEYPQELYKKKVFIIVQKQFFGAQPSLGFPVAQLIKNPPAMQETPV